MGEYLIEYQNFLLGQGLKRNGVNSLLIGVRSFFSSECVEVKFRCGAVVRTQAAIGEHVFSIDDFRRMYSIADIRDKAVLSTAVSLGWSVGDFSSLKRDFIQRLVNRAKSTNQEFIQFDYEGSKEETPMLGILSPDSITGLDLWLNYSSKYKSDSLWPDLNEESFSELLKRLAEKSGIVTQGTVRFHLLRKFVMDTVSSQGLNEFEVKIIVGKAIPLSDATYLTTIKRTAFQKYQKAFSSFSLKGSESNHKFDRSHEDRTGSDLGSRTKLLSHTPCASACNVNIMVPVFLFIES